MIINYVKPIYICKLLYKPRYSGCRLTQVDVPFKVLGMCMVKTIAWFGRRLALVFKSDRLYLNSVSSFTSFYYVWKPLISHLAYQVDRNNRKTHTIFHKEMYLFPKLINRFPILCISYYTISIFIRH